MTMIYPMYLSWNEQNGTRASMSRQALGKALEDKGHTRSMRGRLAYFPWPGTLRSSRLIHLGKTMTDGAKPPSGMAVARSVVAL
jgi:hypothetical protein